jgi:hypothetical protein
MFYNLVIDVLNGVKNDGAYTINEYVTIFNINSDS